MGKLVVTIGVGDQQGRQFEDIEVTVDTGSTFTAVPRTLMQRLGVPVRRSARSRLADGSSVPVDIGWTVVRLEEQIFATQVTFAEQNEPSLLFCQDAPFEQSVGITTSRGRRYPGRPRCTCSSLIAPSGMFRPAARAAKAGPNSAPRLARLIKARSSLLSPFSWPVKSWSIWAVSSASAVLNFASRPRSSPKLNPRWYVHLRCARNRASDVSVGLRPLIAGRCGSDLSPRLSGCPDWPGGGRRLKNSL